MQYWEIALPGLLSNIDTKYQVSNILQEIACSKMIDYNLSHKNKASLLKNDIYELILYIFAIQLNFWQRLYT